MGSTLGITLLVIGCLVYVVVAVCMVVLVLCMLKVASRADRWTEEQLRRKEMK